MELLFVVVGLVILGFILFGLFGTAFIGYAASKDQAAKESAPTILDNTFNGAPHVSYQTGIGRLSYEDVVIGATYRGYELTNQANIGNYQTLVFTRVQLDPHTETEYRRRREAEANAVREREQKESTKRQWRNAIGLCITGLVLLIGAAFVGLIEIALFLYAAGLTLLAFGVKRLVELF